MVFMTKLLNINCRRYYDYDLRSQNYYCTVSCSFEMPSTYMWTIEFQSWPYKKNCWFHVVNFYDQAIYVFSFCLQLREKNRGKRQETERMFCSGTVWDDCGKYFFWFMIITLLINLHFSYEQRKYGNKSLWEPLHMLKNKKEYVYRVSRS